MRPPSVYGGQSLTMAAETTRSKSDKQTQEPSAPARAYAAAFPPISRNTIPCMWCQAQVTDIGEHIRERHEGQTLSDYAKQYPRALLIVNPTKPTPPEDLSVTVTAAEAKRHPGGRHGAIFEKQLDPRDRKAYRDDIVALIKEEGFPAGYEIACLAYSQTLARRFRMINEQNRAKSNGQIIDTSIQDQLGKVEKTVAEMRKTLEASKRARLELERQTQDDDPLQVVEQTLSEAEAWVRANVGEFVEQCPNPSCGQMLTPPGLPHWAFEPLMTESGRQYPVWSTEAWTLVMRRELRLAHMSFILRTSPEGLKMTAELRGERWPEWIMMEEEENILRRYLNEADDAALMLPARTAPDEVTA